MLRHTLTRLGIAAAAAASLAFAGHAEVSRAVSVTYAPGWNLVAGPAGSKLNGAVGPLYTLQPGDSTYEVFPAGSPLKDGYGYWAYFPNGGSIDLPIRPTSNFYAVEPVAGQYVMAGDPSSTFGLSIIGADVAFTYTPANGYQQATSVPLGQGFFVLSSGIVTLNIVPARGGGLGRPPPPVTGPVPAPTPGPQPQ